MPKNLIKPSDAKSWSLCKRRVWFDNHPPENFQIEIDAFDQLVIDLGLAHEKAVLAELAQGYPVASAQSVQHTHALMAEGVAVIYQAELLDEGAGLTGKPDFLIRHESGCYQAADAKLALDENKKGYSGIHAPLPDGQGQVFPDQYLYGPTTKNHYIVTEFHGKLPA